jgi:hypothetical protein
LGAVVPKERKWQWDRFLPQPFAVSIIPPTLQAHSPTHRCFPNSFVRGTLFNSVNIYGTHTYVSWSLICHIKVRATRRVSKQMHGSFKHSYLEGVLKCEQVYQIKV